MRESAVGSSMIATPKRAVSVWQLRPNGPHHRPCYAKNGLRFLLFSGN